MVKNKKFIIVFILMMVFLFTNVTFTQASDKVEDLPVIDSDLNEPIIEPTQNNVENNVEKPINTNNDNSIANDSKLPQTGVASDTTLFIFIGICILSSVYAYVKIKKYNNVH